MAELYRKITKFESNSQLTVHPVVGGQLLNYIAKLQNLKAIHNRGIQAALLDEAELYRKITKFESNSQQFRGYNEKTGC